MNEFKEMDVQSDYKEKVSTIATKLAINKYNAMQGKNVNLNSEIDVNIQLVNNKISQIYNEIKNELIGINLPKDLNDTIAEYLLRSIKPGEFKIEKIGNTEKISQKIVFDEILKDEEKKEIYIENKENEISILNELSNDKKIEDIGTVIETITLENGTEFVFINPYDERFRIPENESKDVEIEIMNEQCRIGELEQDFAFGKIDLETAIGEYKEGLNGLKLDARLRNVFGVLELFGAIELVRDDSPMNQYRRESLFALLEATKAENAEANGFEEDSYTMAMKLGIYSRILNNPAMNVNGKYQNEIKRKMKEANPELYMLLEKEPKVLEIIQTISGTDNPSDASIIIFGDSEPRSKEEFLQKMKELAEKNREIPLDPNVTKASKDYVKQNGAYFIELREEEKRREHREYLERIRSLPYEEKVQYRKNQIISNIEASGIGIAIASTFSKNMLDMDNGEIVEAIEEIFDFNDLDKTGNYVRQITAEDIELMKRRLDSLLEYQTEENRPYIMALGNIIKGATELEKGKILSADNIDVKTLIDGISNESPKEFDESFFEAEER